jgi:low temperature requirement protein LtrA
LNSLALDFHAHFDNEEPRTEDAMIIALLVVIVLAILFPGAMRVIFVVLAIMGTLMFVGGSIGHTQQMTNDIAIVGH